MATSAERMRAVRERQRRGGRRLTIDVSEDDLRAIAERCYQGTQAPNTISRRKLSSPKPSLTGRTSEQVTVSLCRAGHDSSMTISKHELAEIARSGYPGATDGDSDPQCTAEAVNLFVNDMIVCLDRAE